MLSVGKQLSSVGEKTLKKSVDYRFICRCCNFALLMACQGTIANMHKSTQSVQTIWTLTKDNSPNTSTSFSHKTFQPLCWSLLLAWVLPQMSGDGTVFVMVSYVQVVSQVVGYVVEYALKTRHRGWNNLQEKLMLVFGELSLVNVLFPAWMCHRIIRICINN